MKLQNKLLIIAAAVATFAISTNAQGEENHAKTDGKTYQMVCDPTNSAQFPRGPLAHSHCSYVDTDALAYMDKHEKPCDTSATGRILRSALGQACDITKNLKVGELHYVRIQECNERSPTGDGFSSCMDIFKADSSKTE